MENSKAVHPTFEDFLSSIDKYDRSRLSLVFYTSSCRVKLVERSEGEGEDRELFVTDSIEDFLLEVGEALRIESYIS